METQRNRERTEIQPCDPVSVERGVRQRLADKISGNLAGIWLLVAEHLRLGTWDLPRGWTQQPTERVEPRLALQLVHESALCVTGIRAQRTLPSRGGFELVNGLPFVATDSAIHQLLGERSVADTIALQAGLGKLRRASGHFSGKLLAIDPHRIPSHTKRHMRRRAEKSGERMKMAQTFWVLDAHTHQPVCFTTATAASNVSRVTPDLLRLSKDILKPITGNQALGWNRAGTMNLNIRYGQMTMALIAQAVIHQLRGRLGEPYSTWNAEHLAKDLFYALEGDVRVTDDTIIVTYYNAPDADRLRSYYEGLPEKLRNENVRPEIPWLYGYQLDFRFR